MMAQQYFPASLFRGGTSKGVYIRERELPADRDRWDDLLLQTFGSPDPKQVDGVGGSHSTASKAMIISPGDDDIDVEYLFGQVGIEKPVVDWGGNCGNLSFAIGPFALERGVATAEPDSDGKATLRLRNENTGTVVEQTLPVDEEGNPGIAASLPSAAFREPAHGFARGFSTPAAPSPTPSSRRGTGSTPSTSPASDRSRSRSSTCRTRVCSPARRISR